MSFPSKNETYFSDGLFTLNFAPNATLGNWFDHCWNWKHVRYVLSTFSKKNPRWLFFSHFVKLKALVFNLTSCHFLRHQTFCWNAMTSFPFPWGARSETSPKLCIASVLTLLDYCGGISLSAHKSLHWISHPV